MKQETKPYPLIHPTTIVVVGTIHNHVPNYTTIGDIAVAGLNPPLLMVSFHQDHQATKYINEKKMFSVNIATASMMEKVDYCGIHSAKKKDKSAVFQSSMVDGLPLIDESPISLIVEVIDTVIVKTRVIYVCAVKHTFIEDSLHTEEGLNLERIKPLLYGLDNSYYSHITKIGKGYTHGKNYK